MSLNKSYRRGTVTISLGEVVLGKAIEGDDLPIAILICAGAVEVILGWFMQIVSRYKAPSDFFPQMLMAFRALCRNIMYLEMLVMVAKAITWVLRNCLS
jgi:hypothetical protein